MAPFRAQRYFIRLRIASINKDLHPPCKDFHRNGEGYQSIDLLSRMTFPPEPSSYLCKSGENAGFQFQAKSLEDGVDDAVHGLHVVEADHGPGTAAHFDESSLVVRSGFSASFRFSGFLTRYWSLYGSRAVFPALFTPLETQLRASPGFSRSERVRRRTSRYTFKSFQAQVVISSSFSRSTQSRIRAFFVASISSVSRAFHRRLGTVCLL